MQHVFKDHNLQHVFNQQGFVVIDLLGKKEIEALRLVYSQHFPATTSNFFINIWDNNFAERKAISDKTKNILLPFINELVDNFKFVVSAFTAKKAKSEEIFDLHQDITITDESLFPSVSLWCPLQDVDEHNGTICVVPGSHRIPVIPRGINIPSPIEKISQLLKKKYSHPITMKMGQVIIWDHKLIHGSDINNTQSDRIASVSLLIPEKAPILIYHNYKKSGLELHTEVFKLEEDYYNYYDVTQKPSGEQVSLYKMEKIIFKNISEIDIQHTLTLR
jgi:ectoine hydroxylase-related dioxygenase (phytanoyl-CoA dioxygenase family)